MLNPLDSTQEVKKYLRKLLRLIEQEAVFTFFKTKLVNKSRVDDIICCIEANFSDEYKAYIKKTGGKKLSSYKLWLQILGVVKNKFSLSPSLYAVRKAQAVQAITAMISALDSDMKIIGNEASGMF